VHLSFRSNVGTGLSPWTLFLGWALACSGGGPIPSAAGPTLPPPVDAVSAVAAPGRQADEVDGPANGPANGRVNGTSNGLVFSSSRSGDLEVWLQESGAPPRSLTARPGPDYAAPGPPGGGAALVLSTLPDGREQLRVVPFDGTESVALTPAARTVRGPVWSADGAWLVFESDANGFRDLWRVQRDGSSLLQLTSLPNGAFEPSISPDGETVVFAASGASGASGVDLHTVSASGGDASSLATIPGDETGPVWSRDGRRVAFFAERDRAVSVHTIAADGTGERVAWRPGGGDGALLPDQGLAWSPAGAALLVTVRLPSGAPGVRVVDAARGRVLRAVDGLEGPAWVVDGSAFLASRSPGGDGSQGGVVRVSVMGDAVDDVVSGEAWLVRPIRGPATR
jgi:TolB protein